MLRKKIILVISVIVLILVSTSCNNNLQEKTWEGQKEKVKLCEVTHSVFYAPLYATIEQGFFEEEGLEVELSNGGGADKVMTAVLSEQADIGFAGPESCIYTYLEGKTGYPKVFGQVTKRDGSFLIGRENENFSWDKLKGSTVLGGRKGGVPEMTLEYVLRNNGLIPGVDIEVDTSIQFDMMAGAFSGGTGDYVTLFEPTATSMEKEGRGFVLTSIGEESGEIPYTAFFAMQNYLKSNNETITKFTGAISRGQKWVSEHSAAEVTAAIQNQFPDTDFDDLTHVIQRYKDIDAWNESLVMKEETFDRLQMVMEQAGELKERVDFDLLVDNRWAEKEQERGN